MMSYHCFAGLRFRLRVEYVGGVWWVLGVGFKCACVSVVYVHSCVRWQHVRDTECFRCVWCGM